jgi:peptidoglycan hydrolase-like protein with peptidoglycan-binding domain
VAFFIFLKSPIYQRFFKMIINLTKPFASNGKADETDVKTIKTALNRLGYYVPYEKTGLSDIPDKDVFSALKTFQSEHGLPATGRAKPDDETLRALNTAIAQIPDDGQYIWRCTDDDKVRDAHAQYNGTIRRWGDSPSPGEDYNCRCWADFKGLKLDLINEIPEGLHQELISEDKDATRKWTELDFTAHAYNGNGKAITLSKTGYLGAIIEKAREVMLRRVEDQVAEKMREIKSGKLIYTTENSYPGLGEVLWVFGGGTIRTKTEGVVTKDGDILSIEAVVDYEYYDTFTDLVSIRQKKVFYGTSNPNVVPPWIVKLTDFGATYYHITDRWTTRLTGTIIIKKK